MTTKTRTYAIKSRKPAVIREGGAPRFVILDWETYKGWEEAREDMEDHIRFEITERESRGRKRYTLAEIEKKYRLS